MHRHLKLQLPHLKPHHHSDGSMHVHMYERTDLRHSASSLAVMAFSSGESVFVCLFFHKMAHQTGMTLSINIEIVLLRLSIFSFCSSLSSDISKTRLCILLARKKQYLVFLISGTNSFCNDLKQIASDVLHTAESYLREHVCICVQVVMCLFILVYVCHCSNKAAVKAILVKQTTTTQRVKR